MEEADRGTRRLPVARSIRGLIEMRQEGSRNFAYGRKPGLFFPIASNSGKKTRQDHRRPSLHFRLSVNLPQCGT